jgi:hypothetical protein
MAIELTAKAYLPRQSMERSADVVLVHSSSPFGNEEKIRAGLAFEVPVSTRLVHRHSTELLLDIVRKATWYWLSREPDSLYTFRYSWRVFLS